MVPVRATAAICSALVIACVASQPRAQPYPSKPIRVIVPFTAGSATDILARLVGPKLNEAFGQQVVVDNRPSAGGTVAGSIVATAVPDGYTLMLTSSVFAGAAALYSKLPYDTLKDFAGITQIASTPLLLVVSPAIGVKTVPDLILLAKQKPGQINFGSSGIGAGPHYCAELFKHVAKINVVHVPYKGTPEVLNDVMAGRVQYSFAPPLATMPLVKSGRLLALAVTTRERLSMAPDIPTVAEAALPGFEYDGWYGMLAPAKTPRAFVNAISKEVGRILQLPDVRERIASQGATPRSSTPDAFDRYVREEIGKRSTIFKAAGTKVE